MSYCKQFFFSLPMQEVLGFHSEIGAELGASGASPIYALSGCRAFGNTQGEGKKISFCFWIPRPILAKSPPEYVLHYFSFRLPLGPWVFRYIVIGLCFCSQYFWLLSFTWEGLYPPNRTLWNAAVFCSMLSMLGFGRYPWYALGVVCLPPPRVEPVRVFFFEDAILGWGRFEWKQWQKHTKALIVLRMKEALRQPKCSLGTTRYVGSRWLPKASLMTPMTSNAETQSRQSISAWIPGLEATAPGINSDDSVNHFFHIDFFVAFLGATGVIFWLETERSQADCKTLNMNMIILQTEWSNCYLQRWYHGNGPCIPIPCWY